VLEAVDGEEALQAIRTEGGRLALLVTDVLMPGMTGGELVNKALELHPALKVLFMSGHAESAIVRTGVAKGLAFLAKPYTPSDLAHKVRLVLDAEP
jgi:CheY-like chemotaxis protein